jgi:hypothetical protein
MQAAGETGRFAVASLALGAIGYYGSEALFWGFPPEGITPLIWLATIVTYALVGACALAAVIWTGLGGWRAAFLGGALLGWLIEGVVVDTAYEAFPFQLVWVPLAWHATVTGLIVFGLLRTAASGPVFGQVALLIAVGLGGAAFSGFWPTERPVLPPAPRIFLYQIASGLVAVAGFAAFGRLGALPRPPVWVLLVVPCLALAVWLAKSAMDPRPVRLLVPLLLAVTLWAMRRLGDNADDEIPSAPLSRHMRFMIIPLILAPVAAFVVRGTPGIPSGAVAVLTLSPIGLFLWLWLVFRAFRQKSREVPR